MRAFLLLAALAGGAAFSADSAGGIRWAAPASWKAQAPRPMRAATYTVPPANGDTEVAECAVYYFGQGEGGTADANLKRWIGQIEQAEGDPKTDHLTVRGLKVATLDLAGTYIGGGGPMARTVVKKPHYRLLGAIVEAPQGPVFFKFTGPQKTIAANQKSFDAMVRGIQR